MILNQSVSELSYFIVLRALLGDLGESNFELIVHRQALSQVAVERSAAPRSRLPRLHRACAGSCRLLWLLAQSLGWILGHYYAD
jgi:hypothetical protein